MTPSGLVKVTLGQIVATPAALGAVSQADIAAALRRHAVGDWGDASPDDRATNDDALKSGERLLSTDPSRPCSRRTITDKGFPSCPPLPRASPIREIADDVRLLQSGARNTGLRLPCARFESIGRVANQCPVRSPGS